MLAVDFTKLPLLKPLFLFDLISWKLGCWRCLSQWVIEDHWRVPRQSQDKPWKSGDVSPLLSAVPCVWTLWMWYQTGRWSLRIQKDPGKHGQTWSNMVNRCRFRRLFHAIIFHQFVLQYLQCLAKWLIRLLARRTGASVQVGIPSGPNCKRRNQR